MDYKEQIHNYVQKHKDEIVDTLKGLVKIPSVRGDAVSDAPFGKECAEVLEYVRKLYAKNGFETELDQNGGYLLSYYGKGEKSLGLFAHADVVPVADDWIYTKPFEPTIKDGCLVGRGVLDDKSAVVISLYCTKMLKELQLPFNSRLVCFTGANEESGMADIKNYVKSHTPPDFSLVADTAFPLYRGNKGMLQLTAICNNSFDTITEIKGNNAKGAILGGITMKLKYDEELYNYLKKGENDNLAVTVIDEEIVVKSTGISAHTAVPEGSLNAARPIFSSLSECKQYEEQMPFMSALVSDYYGGALGIENDDKTFGKLTFANDMIYFENGKISMHFNLRFGSDVDIASLKGKIDKEFEKMGWCVDFERESPAHLTDINNPILQTCLKTYKEFTGDLDSPCRINAGGTYARYLTCAIETGTTLDWSKPVGNPKGHGGAHQPDESININSMLDALELTMLMLIECDKEISK